MKTTQVYTSENWAADGTFKANIGQIVADDVVAQLRDSVPPQTMQSGLLQIGEAVNHDFAGHPLYTTFEHTLDGWRYCGSCHEGKTINRLGWGSVEADRVIVVAFEGIDDHNRPVFKIDDLAKKWRFGCVARLFDWDATEKQVREKFEQIGDSIRSDFFYFGNRFGCEPDGTPLNAGDKIIIHWTDGQMIF